MLFLNYNYSKIKTGDFLYPESYTKVIIGKFRYHPTSRRKG